jgi:hypothetical protein
VQRPLGRVRPGFVGAAAAGRHSTVGWAERSEAQHCAAKTKRCGPARWASLRSAQPTAQRNLRSPNHCINPPVGAASWPRSRRRTALLPDGVRTSLSLNSRIRTPGCISSCQSPVETGLPPRFYATSGFRLCIQNVDKSTSVKLLTAGWPPSLAAAASRMNQQVCMPAALAASSSAGISEQNRIAPASSCNWSRIAA